MFDIGFSELLIVALIGLIVLGPKRLPEVARTAGQWLGRLRRFVADVKHDFDHELQQAELAELRTLKQELDETRRTIEETSGQLMREANAMSDDVASSARSIGETPVDEAGPPPDAPAKRRTARRRKSPVKQQDESSG